MSTKTTAVTTTYDYSRDAYSVLAYAVDSDVLDTADREITSIHLDLIGEPADVFETENGPSPELAIESGEEVDAWAACFALRSQRGFVVVGPSGRVER